MSFSPADKNAISRCLSLRAAPQPPPSTATPEIVLATYLGSYRQLLYRLKLFSLSTLSLSITLGPFLLMAGHDVSTIARSGLFAAALFTSIGSTSLIAWIGKPYVGRLNLKGRPNLPPVIEAYTLSWRLRTLKTRIYQPSLIRPTTRPFACWELPEQPGPGLFPPSSTSAGPGQADEDKILVSETLDAETGKVVGKWWLQRVPKTSASPTEQGGVVQAEGGESKEEAKCFAEGKPVRHFQVQEELLGEEWKILG